MAGIRTKNLVELIDAGEELDVVASDFGLTESDLRAALAYEWRPRQRGLSIAEDSRSSVSSNLTLMSAERLITAEEMELMSPDERARLVVESSSSLDDLDSEFRQRVAAKSRRLAEERGLLDPEHS